MRILIADDDKDFSEALACYVRECDHEVVDTVTGGGLSVIKSFARYQPDVVLLDIRMPKFNGLTVCHALLSRQPGAKIVFVSGSIEGGHPFVKRCGATAYLSKPVLLQELRDTLDHLAA